MGIRLGRYKSSLGMYCVRMASNHTAALYGGEFGGHHYLVYLLTCQLVCSLTCLLVNLSTCLLLNLSTP